MIALCLAGSLTAPVLGKRASTMTLTSGYSFEDSTIPAEWQAAGLDLSISDRHFKDGTHSLAWHWHTGQILRVNRPRGLEEISRDPEAGICVWIYNESPINGALTFRFGSEEELNAGSPAPYQFQFGLNYKGWRAAWVQFAEDAANSAYHGVKNPSLEAMQLIAPDGASVAQGTIFLDQLQFQKVGWLRTPDYQLPFINATRGGPNVSEDMKDQHIDINGYNWSQLKPPIAPSTITAEQKQAFKTIADRYDQWLYGKDLDPKSEPYYQIRFDALNKYIDSGKAAFEKLNIRRNGDTITGTPLFALMDPARTPSFTDVFENCFLPLALDWKLNHNQQSKQNFFELLDYVHDQGWDEGSSNGTLDHAPLRVAGYMHAVYIMRDELKATGRLDLELATMRWYTYFDQAYWAELPPGNSADQIRNAMLHKLLMVLAMEDSPEKVRDMQSLVFWENQALAIAPGWADCIKPDFTGFHHRGIYGNVYAPDAFHMGALCFYLQHGTAFSMSDQSADNLRNALLTERIITNKYVAPIAISGRMPFAFGTSDRISPGFAYMALSADTPDNQMAAAFKRLWDPNDPEYQDEVIGQARAGIFYPNGLGALQLMKQVVDMDVKPETAPSGNWIKPYGGLMIHRRGEWMLSVKAWSKYVWSFERSPTENVFGRNISFGFVQILGSGQPVNREASGYVENGWDWNHWPGTTTVNLPLDELNDSSNRMRTYSDQSFVGGVSLKGNGLFAMRLHDTAYDPSFYANKSVFCFDDRVICLGSGIINNAKNSTNTTLFQTSLTSSTTPTWINDTNVATGVDTSLAFTNGQKVWLTDSAGNGYVIPHAQGLHVERRHQASIENTGNKRTQGDFTVAWIDHGSSPHDSSYEYAILVQGGSPPRVQQFADTPNYEVLRHDDAVHAVRDTQSGAAGYAIFDAARPVNLGILKQVSIPCMAMLHQSGDELKLSVANPDLGLIPPNQPPPADIEGGITSRNLLRRASPQSSVRVTLAGEWEVASQGKARVVGSDGINTVVEVTCQNGLTTQCALHRN
jgi:chondroitin-sulfate-ABC endolyase/exolyase